ncbi:peptidoglycan DD-metalloendopeptidase family protein [Dokdonia sp. PRO95]|uniref:peptidoglycan DD-metalloendopeptidase family protein n=1 Tax=Dokdonia sp. PRO95 TaxID=1239415 RepID=UPI000550AB22|nr:peptidoglycan DD-metalloendopeptidase family protein [Dokdonia sp. PRO95]
MNNTFLSSLTQQFTPIINPTFQKEDYFPLDLSTANKDLDIDMLTRPHDHHDFLQAYLAQNDAKVAYGGYLEQRPLYDRSDYFQATDPKDKRNIHLGIDLWCDEGTGVLSPLEGEIHSFKRNENFGDYGPTIILKHKIGEHTFHTLYGHLSLSSLEGKEVGQKVAAGELIATLGAPDINGDYAPHLHFQIVIDMEGKEGDYAGVGSQNTLDFYKNNCPDPNLLLKIY